MRTKKDNDSNAMIEILLEFFSGECAIEDRSKAKGKEREKQDTIVDFQRRQNHHGTERKLNRMIHRKHPKIKGKKRIFGIGKDT